MAQDSHKKTTKKITPYTGKEEVKMKAFTLRFKGCTYAQMHKETGLSEWELQHRFCKNGVWQEEYEAWVKDRTEDINKQLSTMFTAQAIESMQQIVNIARGLLVGTLVLGDGRRRKISIELKDSTILRANQDVLDRAGFKPPERIEVDSDSEGMADEIIRKMEERKLARLKEEASKKHDRKPSKNTGSQ